MKKTRSFLALVATALALLPVVALAGPAASAANDARVTERNGVLRIVGTRGDDHIEMCVARNGLMTLTVSTASSPTFEFSSVRSMVATLSDGDDLITIGCDEWADIGPDLRINSGRGDDALRFISGCCVGPILGRLTLTDSAGETNLSMQGARILGRADVRARRLTITLGDETLGDEGRGMSFADRVNIRAVEQLDVVADFARFEGPTRFLGGTGDDQLNLLNTTAAQGTVLTFIGGRGNDSFIERQDDRDILDRSFWFGRLAVNLGPGDDSMTLTRDLIAGDRLDGSAGEDELWGATDLGARLVRFETVRINDG